MRLIDADALKAEFKRPSDWMDRDQALVHITGIWAEIDCAPTVQPERKRGKWMELNRCGAWRCSACGETISSIMGKPRYNFCPMCGAEMEEQE